MVSRVLQSAIELYHASQAYEKAVASIYDEGHLSDEFIAASHRFSEAHGGFLVTMRNHLAEKPDASQDGCDEEMIEDGFGNGWPRWCEQCGEENQIVRPGKVQCGCG